MSSPAIVVSRLSKTFRGGRRALDDVNVAIMPGEMVALIGASGSGKSTLLRHISGLTTADCGADSRVEVLGRVAQAGGRLASDIRALRAQVGFVFQQFNLVDRLPVITNVLAGLLHRVPAWRGVLRWFTHAETAAGLDALRRVGIGECAWQRASTLSGGQQQRAAISRALVQQAKIILADEPIASLDPESSRRVMDLLASINRESGVTVIVSLHQVQYALRYCPRVVALRAGRVVYDGPSAALTTKRLHELYGSQTDEILASDAILPGARGENELQPALEPGFAALRLAAGSRV
jgi:phosphonate transport system ATP-binding protein